MTPVGKIKLSAIRIGAQSFSLAAMMKVQRKKAGAPYRIAPAWLGKIMRYCASTSTYYTNSRKRALYG
jgi:hypothetical protein